MPQTSSQIAKTLSKIAGTHGLVADVGVPYDSNGGVCQSVSLKPRAATRNAYVAPRDPHARFTISYTQACYDAVAAFWSDVIGEFGEDGVVAMKFWRSPRVTGVELDTWYNVDHETELSIWNSRGSFALFDHCSVRIGTR